MDKSEPNIVAVIGTDTDAGKTVVTAGLLRAATDMGLSVQAVKPAQSGCLKRPDGELAAPDLDVYREACPAAALKALVKLAAPCSPHLAARLEKVSLSALELARGVLQYARIGDARDGAVTLMEGAGGLLSPINERETFADVLQLLDAPALLVAANRLGAINHALLSLEASRSRGLKVAGLILTETAQANRDLEKRIRLDNFQFLKSSSGLPFALRLPHAPGLSSSDAAGRKAAWNEIGERLRGAARRLFERKRPSP
jgi:dethiobiotin synthase